MLSDAQLLQAARAYAQQYYGDDDGLTRHAELSDPPGAYFSLVEPEGMERTGDAGFFIFRTDGHVVQLGTGAFTGYAAADLMEEATFIAILRRIVLATSKPL
jgi:hypothetical protein